MACSNIFPLLPNRQVVGRRNFFCLSLCTVCAANPAGIEGSDSSPLSTPTRSAVRGLIAAAAEREEASLNKASFEPSCAKPPLLAIELSATILAVCFFSSAHYRPLALVPAQATPSSRFERFQHKHHAYLQALVRPLSGWRQASLTWSGHGDSASLAKLTLKVCSGTPAL